MYKRFLFISFSFLILISTASCTGSLDSAEEKKLINELYSGNFAQVKNPSQAFLAKLKNTDEASLYYIGLHLKNAKYYRSSAKTFFEYSVNNCVFPYNQLSRDELYSLSSNKEKLKIIEAILADEKVSFAKKEKAREAQQKIFLLLGEFDKLEKNMPEYLSSIKFDWEVKRFLASFLSDDNKELKKMRGSLPKGFIEINKARLLVSRRKYKQAWNLFDELLADEKIENIIEKYPYLESRNVLSDMGRAALYGSSAYKKNAELFEVLLRNTEKKSFETEFKQTQKYMYAFYAARLNAKVGKKKNVSEALDFFKLSLNYAPTKNDFDNSLWYYLDVLKDRSFSTFFDELCKSIPKWQDDFFYEDLVAYTCRELAFNKDLKRFEKFTSAVAKTDLREAKARNSYILARLYETLNAQTDSKKLQALYLDVSNKKHNFPYYKILANYYLDRKKKNFSETNLFSYSGYRSANSQRENRYSDTDCLILLRGLVKYKLYTEVFRHVYSIYPKISVTEAERFSTVLAKVENYPDSIKLMNFALRQNNEKITRAHLKLIYPRPYLESVRKYAKIYDVPEYLMFGLMRSESFFRASVVSHAGAIGLTQLMKPTAKDIARRLKMTKYDLCDPDTNIQFGTYYISKMIQGKKGDIMAALFSYNAGPNAVRRWQKKYKKYSSDLFLEVLPYAETRGYGRHVLTASSVYALLYYGKSYEDIVEEFFKF